MRTQNDAREAPDMFRDVAENRAVLFGCAVSHRIRNIKNRRAGFGRDLKNARQVIDVAAAGIFG